MQGILSGEEVTVARVEAESFELRGYGRKEGKGAKEEREGKLMLSLEEAAFLLEAGKIVIKREEEKESALTLEELFKHALGIFPNFGARYITYKDLKERGYAVHPGGVDFWLYPRGTKPGEKPARYFIRILSEREFLPVKDLEELLILAHNMRKELIIAVVDDESDITYYKVKEAKFDVIETRDEKEEEKREGRGEGTALLLGDKVVLRNTELAEALYKNHFYGTLTNEGWLLLSLVEAAYLIKRGLLEMSFEQFIEYATSIESDFLAKYAVYADLMEKGLIVKTGFKFGSHFRVYKAMNLKHSSDLIHVLPAEHVFSMPELARAVRLAHGVKKRMIFVYQSLTKNLNKAVARQHLGTVDQPIRYVDIGRMKL
ncbi:MAG: tRNA-intron lyase [archaeon]|nr:tRNA-intron lyase [archaeon]